MMTMTTATARPDRFHARSVRSHREAGVPFFVFRWSLVLTHAGPITSQPVRAQPR